MPLPGWVRLFPMALLLGGLTLAVATGMTSPGRRKALLRMLATLSFGLLLLVCAALELTEVHRLPRMEVTGLVGSVVKHGGRSAHSEFRVYSGGGYVVLHSNYTGDHLADGAVLQVRYLGYRGQVIAMSSPGPHESWSYDEGDGTTGMVFALIAGVVVLLYGIFQRSAHPDGSSKLHPGDEDRVEVPNPLTGLDLENASYRAPRAGGEQD